MDLKTDISPFTNLGYEVTRIPFRASLKIVPTGYSRTYTDPVDLGAAILDIRSKFPDVQIEFQYHPNSKG